MKPLIYLLLLPISFLQAQTVTSSCTGPDTIVHLYLKDGDRLAVRRTYQINSNYKDSIHINKTLSKTYREALIAVYNATALPVRDTIIKMLDIHTNPIPELNTISVMANPAYQWMYNLRNNITPTGDVNVDYLINNFHLQQTAYYLGTSYDMVVFTADSNYNATQLAAGFTVIAGVSGASVVTGYNDVKNITDSVNTNFIMLTYSYGWGTCENGCDHRAYWTFKVFADCSVEYVGISGETLYSGLTGIPDVTAGIKQVQLFPNPVSGMLKIQVNSNSSDLYYKICDITGQIIRDWRSGADEQVVDLEILPAGFYYLVVSNGSQQVTRKIIRE
jgi:hypothetical protein